MLHRDDHRLRADGGAGAGGVEGDADDHRRRALVGEVEDPAARPRGVRPEGQALEALVRVGGGSCPSSAVPSSLQRLRSVPAAGS